MQSLTVKASTRFFLPKAAARTEKLEQIVESLLAKLLLEDDFQELLSLNIPSLPEITKLPPVAIDNLHVFSQIVNKDLMGAATWDGVLKNLNTSRREPIIRVLEGSVNGQKLVQAMSEANSSLQLEIEKHAKVKHALHNLKKSETIQDFAKAVLQVAQMKLLPVGPKVWQHERRPQVCGVPGGWQSRDCEQRMWQGLGSVSWDLGAGHGGGCQGVL